MPPPDLEGHSSRNNTYQRSHQSRRVNPRVASSTSRRQHHPRLVLNPPNREVEHIRVVSLIGSCESARLIRGAFSDAVRIPVASDVGTFNRAERERANSGIDIVTVRRLGFDQRVRAPIQAFQLELAGSRVDVVRLAFRSACRRGTSGLRRSLVFGRHAVGDRNQLLISRSDVGVLGLVLIVPAEVLSLRQLPLRAGKLLAIVGIRGNLVPRKSCRCYGCSESCCR